MKIININKAVLATARWLLYSILAIVGIQAPAFAEGSE